MSYYHKLVNEINETHFANAHFLFIDPLKTIFYL